MKKAIGYIVVSDTDMPMQSGHDGILGVNFQAAEMFPERRDAQKAIDRSATYAKEHGYTQWGCDKWRIWRIVQ